MRVIDVEELLQDVSTELRCGENLEYGDAFSALELAAQGKPERQKGDKTLPAEEPNWKAVKTKALALFPRTKDLRVAMYLLRACIIEDGFIGLQQGLVVLRGLLERHWQDVHPQLDPSDCYDPTMRVNIIASLRDERTLLHHVRVAPLARSRVFGQVSLRDVLLARGELSVLEKPDEHKRDKTAMEAAFKDTDVNQLHETATAITDAITSVTEIEACLTEHVGAKQSVDLSALPQLLLDAQRVISEHLPHGEKPTMTKPTKEGAPVPSETGADRPAGETGEAGHAVLQSLSEHIGPINSREDAVRVLELVCEYFRKHEPSSPVPLLLQRAKRLVSKDFMEILRDLTPSGLEEAKQIGGIPKDDQPK